MIGFTAFLTTLLILTMLGWRFERVRLRDVERRLTRMRNENFRIYRRLFDQNGELTALRSVAPTRGASGRFAKR